MLGHKIWSRYISLIYKKKLTVHVVKTRPKIGPNRYKLLFYRFIFLFDLINVNTNRLSWQFFLLICLRHCLLYIRQRKLIKLNQSFWYRNVSNLEKWQKKNALFCVYLSFGTKKKTLKMLKHIYTFAQNLDKLH